MQFRTSHLRTVTPRRPKSPVYCVGWRAFVNWPQPAGETRSPVPMTDEAGRQIVNDLADGQEVEILSWRPHARASVTYQIRRNTDGSEWWVAVEHLRRRREAAPIEATGAAPS
jgi:hypothetical protein